MEIAKAFEMYPFETFCIRIHDVTDVKKVNQFFDFFDEWDYLDENDEYPHLLIIDKSDYYAIVTTGHDDIEEWDDHVDDDTCYHFDIMELDQMFDPITLTLNQIKKEIHG